jgi:hypothetical protein
MGSFGAKYVGLQKSAPQFIIFLKYKIHVSFIILVSERAKLNIVQEDIVGLKSRSLFYTEAIISLYVFSLLLISKWVSNGPMTDGDFISAYEGQIYQHLL